jgi:hypothetical protein
VTLFDVGDRGATLSPDGLYRYDLTRRWSDVGGTVLWIMLNPSRADADADDPTIRRVVRFSKRWHFGSAVVVNLFAYRSTSPAALSSVDDPVGPDNDLAIARHLEDAHRVVAAWGQYGKLGDRARVVAELAREYDQQLLCLGRTQAGAPRHPLYVKGDVELERWP